MKILSSLTITVLSFCLFSLNATASTTETTLSVENMDCVTCPVVVRGALNDLEGVENVIVSMADKTVVIQYDSKKLTKAELAETVTKAGFPAKAMK